MEISSGVEMLEISANIMGKTNMIYPVFVSDNGTNILVDTGFPGQLSQIHEKIEKAGFTFDELNMIILTHHDIDHIGSLSSIREALSHQIKVFSHEKEKGYIQGDKTPVKLAQLEANLNFLPEEMKVIYEKLKSGFRNSRANVDETLKDGQNLPCCGGITVIFTPGHTPGHICLYLNKSKILIAGDALSVENGTLIQTQASTHFDIDLYKESLKKLVNFDIEAVVCYHGGLYRDNVNERIKELIAEK